jgi:hypothetical protein
VCLAALCRETRRDQHFLEGQYFVSFGARRCGACDCWASKGYACGLLLSIMQVHACIGRGQCHCALPSLWVDGVALVTIMNQTGCGRCVQASHMHIVHAALSQLVSQYLYGTHTMSRTVARVLLVQRARMQSR